MIKMVSSWRCGGHVPSFRFCPHCTMTTAADCFDRDQRRHRNWGHGRKTNRKCLSQSHGAGVRQQKKKNRRTISKQNPPPKKRGKQKRQEIQRRCVTEAMSLWRRPHSLWAKLPSRPRMLVSVFVRVEMQGGVGRGGSRHPPPRNALTDKKVGGVPYSQIRKVEKKRKRRKTETGFTGWRQMRAHVWKRFFFFFFIYRPVKDEKKKWTAKKNDKHFAAK